MKNSSFLIARLYFFCLTIFIYIVNADIHANRMSSKRISHPFTERDYRLLQTSNSFSTAITKLTASNGGTENQFGNAVAILNNRIVVGAWGYNGDQGAAYVFMDPNDPESGRSYSQMAILLASDGKINDYFGYSVDIDGDIIVVGASEEYSYGLGAVYIFRIGDSDNISQVAKITAQKGWLFDGFGSSVAIHGKFILVGAYGVDRNGIRGVGSAYLFVNRSNDSNNQEWTQIMQFQPNDLLELENFGWSVAMDDQIAVVTTWEDEAYVFVPVDGNADSLSSWTQMAKLTGPTNSTFGYSVAVAGNIIVVSAPLYVKNNGNAAGAIFVFSKIDGSSSSSLSWTQTNILSAADGVELDYFGASVSISKDESAIVVGAWLDDYNSTIQDSGAAYLFRNSNTATTRWTQVGKFVAANRDSYDALGISIAIENSIVVVGAPGDDSFAGSVYILNAENSSSPPPTKTTPPFDTTTAPTAEPVVPTFQPSPSPTIKPTNPFKTNPPTTMAPTPNNDYDGNNNNPSPLPVTSTPTTSIPTLSTPTTPNHDGYSTPDPINDVTSKSDNNNKIIISAMVVLGVVVVALGLGISFFRYRLKRDQLRFVEQQERQQQQIIPPPLLPPSSENIGLAAVNTDEMPVMVDIVFPPAVQSTEDRTMEAEVLVDPPLIHAPPTAAGGNDDAIDAEKGLPEFKDQVQNSGPSKPSHQNITSQMGKAKEP